MNRIPVFRPRLLGEPKHLLETLRSSWWGTGPAVAAFEQKFAQFIGAEPWRCVMLSSCTAALHVALKLYPNCRRVLTPALTFVSTALPAVWERLEVVFVEVGDDLCIDQRDALNKIRSEDDVVFAVHMGGQAADLSLLEDRPLVEDCAHALGTFDRQYHVGTLQTGCFSFQATKVLPIGDGGILVLASEDERQSALSLSWCGIAESTWDRSGEQYRWGYRVDNAGHKYRANDVMAALALDQWEGLGPLLARKRQTAARYGEALSGLDWLVTPAARPGTRPNWQEYIVRTPLRDQLHRHLAERGIDSTVHYYPIHNYEPFRQASRRTSLPRTERLAAEILTIPAHESLTEEEQERVIDGVRSFKP